MEESDWPRYWNSKVSDDRLGALETELRRELPTGHVLHGRQFCAVAIGDDPDDVVFELDDGSLAAVHLTWKAETDARWPFTLLFDSLESLGRSEEWE